VTKKPLSLQLTIAFSLVFIAAHFIAAVILCHERLFLDASYYLQAFIKRLVKNKSAIFTFLHHFNVPPDNNASERAIRNVKIKTKISGQFRSFRGAQRFAISRS
jgi:hypothetical protein